MGQDRTTLSGSFVDISGSLTVTGGDIIARENLIVSSALFITASGPDGATFNIPSGTVPTIRYHGDIWMEEDGLHYQSGSTNIGPLLT